MSGETGITDVSGRVWDRPGTARECALLVVDVQRDFADPAVLTWLDEAGRDRVAAAVERTSGLVAAARAAGVRVVWVGLGQDPAQPWAASRWLRGLPADPADDPAEEPCVEGSPGAAWFGVAPEPGEEVVVKRRYSGFHGTGLADTLRSAGTTWVAAAGLTTECCVDATVRDAFQLGFRTVVAADATAAYEEDAHRHALAVLGQNAAVVATADAIAAAWGRDPESAGAAGTNGRKVTS
ncbi:cysteine hydrolase family protein [Nocardiopsis sp. YSL2]|uniref:cysteine hydrolase family protein n=1 Tax=Nocardiopsis sp. YSL2 TaxID=2939492 RepID=UPI0026F45F55|nr:isochorismatase family cysteine hydrolase [Nocardiopsis sp. YSL2]